MTTDTENEETSSGVDYNNLVDGLFSLANTALGATLKKNPAAAATNPASQPGMIYGYPIKTVAITVALGLVVLFFCYKIFKSA